MMTHVGGRIRALRAERQMTLPALAEASSLSKGLLSKLENDPESNPSIETLYKVAEAFKVTVADLLDAKKVQLRRVVLETTPPWLEGLTKALQEEGTQMDDDILQALYVLQARKTDARRETSVWMAMYRSLEMSFAPGRK